jgi:hypothetical protein
MGKHLREITAMRAPEISSAVWINKLVYVKDNRDNILFLLPADKLLGYTSTSVTIKQGTYALTYNNMGTQVSLQTIR